MDMINDNIGKFVTLTAQSGAEYSGLLWRQGKDHVKLSHLSLRFKSGGMCVSKSKTSRSFTIDNIRSIAPIPAVG